MGLCGRALGGWRARDQAYQAHLLPLFVCFSLCKPSSWSRPKFTQCRKYDDHNQEIVMQCQTSRYPYHSRTARNEFGCSSQDWTSPICIGISVRWGPRTQ
ncbi:hypothetical protein Taro_011079 [Colocasia esculenta]|uniref:Uncharacterized protein n=1 Tax=Colocasia esculenta TaxID=4460 RepID=A0A843UBK0_COLES|nr:hypothetical protein [Colocasia esculenta]